MQCMVCLFHALELDELREFPRQSMIVSLRDIRGSGAVTV